MDKQEHRELPAAQVLIRTASQQIQMRSASCWKQAISRLFAVSYDSKILRLALPYIIKANPALLASGTYYVAETEPGILVGCGGWTAEKPGSGETAAGEAHIRHFAIHPEWTRRGIGASLLARCIRDARSLGIRKLHCFSA
jgi:GNAT superfamily N-acetyltransferase